RSPKRRSSWRGSGSGRGSPGGKRANGSSARPSRPAREGRSASCSTRRASRRAIPRGGFARRRGSSGGSARPGNRDEANHEDGGRQRSGRRKRGRSDLTASPIDAKLAPMDVLVVRHGIALDREKAEGRGITDPDRALTRKGRDRFERAARGLAAYV